MKLQQVAASLSALWAGIMIGVGYLFAPILFEQAPLPARAIGRLAGEAFTMVSYLGLGAGLIILLLVKRQNNRAGFSTPNAALLLTMVALTLTIVGQFILHPEIAKAREFGQTALSFSALHGISQILYLIQVLVLLILNWILYRPIVIPKHVQEALQESHKTKSAKEHDVGVETPDDVAEQDKPAP